MKRHLTYLFAALLACACAPGTCPVPPAMAAGAESDIGSLSSRYSQLDDLAGSRNPDENVVVETRISVLTGANQALDDSSVRFEGELVGEAVRASDGMSWASVNGSTGQAISVLFTDEQLSGIEVYGDYQHTGAHIRVTGMYHVACDEHQGELDVHATAVELCDEGSAVAHELNMGRVIAACAFVTAGLALLASYVLLSRRANGKGKA